VAAHPDSGRLPTLPTLSDCRVLLRAVQLRDLPAIEAGIHDPDVIRWIGPQPSSARDVVVRDEAWRAQGSPTLAICELDGTCVGKVWLEVHETDPVTGFVGYWLLPDGRGRGLATSAVRLISAWAVRDLGVTNLRIRAAPDNQRSHRVAERSGFRRVDPAAGESPDRPDHGDLVFALDSSGTSAPT
jgi:ribosomal-protein-alanine N-acetyltransferase